MSEYFQVLHDGTTHLLQLLENDRNKIVVLLLWLVVLSAVMRPTVMLLSTRVTAMTSRPELLAQLFNLRLELLDTAGRVMSLADDSVQMCLALGLVGTNALFEDPLGLLNVEAVKVD
ncbi:hypothetical protein HG531_003037 [Fusarium graminearum]|nr:hypothetical protein HG531_003037 [Fusarium graminearum]